MAVGPYQYQLRQLRFRNEPWTLTLGRRIRKINLFQNCRNQRFRSSFTSSLHLNVGGKKVVVNYSGNWRRCTFKWTELETASSAFKFPTTDWCLSHGEPQKLPSFIFEPCKNDLAVTNGSEHWPRGEKLEHTSRRGTGKLPLYPIIKYWCTRTSCT